MTTNKCIALWVFRVVEAARKTAKLTSRATSQVLQGWNETVCRAALVALGVLVSSCGGGGSGGAPGPQVSDLHADQSVTSLNVPVTFFVTCTGPSGSSNLTYRWHFGDEPSESDITLTTSAPTSVHRYTLRSGDSAANTYDLDQYFVVCVDGNSQSSSGTKSMAGAIQVLRQDLSTLAGLSCSSGTAGVGWCWQSPLPSGADLTAVNAVSDQIAWVAGGSGSVLHTSDGGAHWQPSYPVPLGGRAPDFLTIKAADANTAWAVAADGSFWNTSDGGTSWNAQRPASALSLRSVASTDSTHAWATAGGNSILSTTDGGAHWSQNGIPSLAAGAQVSAVAALDASNVFAVGSGVSFGASSGDGFEVESSNAGAQWSTPLALQPPSGGSGVTPLSVAVTDSSRCGNSTSAATDVTVWVGAGYEYYPLPDGAVPATTVFAWPRAAMLPGSPRGAGEIVAAFDGLTVWSTDNNLLMYFSNDAFATIGSFNYATSSALPMDALDSADCTNGWGVGPIGRILHTSDGAADWSPQSDAPPAKFVAASAASSMQAVAFSATETSQPPPGGGLEFIYDVYATSNGGSSWTRIHSDSLGTPNGSAAAIATDAAGDIVVGGVSYLVIYADGSWGANLAFAAAPSLYAQFGSISISNRSAWMLDTGYGTLWLDDLSINPPIASMPHVSTEGVYPQAVGAVDPTHAVVVSGDGAIALAGYESGTWSWTVQPKSAQPLTAVAFSRTGATTGRGWAVGYAGSILRTNDGGHTWTSQNWNDAQVNFTSVSTIDGMEAWAVGNGIETVPEPGASSGETLAIPFGVVLHTADGGATWTQSLRGTSPSYLSIGAVTAAAPFTAWLAGPFNSLRKTVTGGLVPAPPASN